MKTRTANGKLKAVKYEDEDSKGDAELGDTVAYDHDSASDDEPPPLKRRRRSRGNANSKASDLRTKKGKGKVHRGRNVGKLAKLLEMPVDIFCEISAHLEPLDLLRLARSTRGFHEMLMSRSSKPIWRTARNYYVDLPDCPPDLSEPEYARLLFERDCHACLAPRVLKVNFILRARLCHRCRSSNIVKGTQLMKSIPQLTEELLGCIPCRNEQWSGGRHRRLEYFYSARVEALVTKYYATAPEGASADEAEVIRKEFRDRKKALINEIVTHAADIEKWLQSDRKTKGARDEEASQRRAADIRAKLVELGHKENDFPTSWMDPQFSTWIQIMNQPRDLTPRIWTTSRPKLEACIQSVKDHRESIARQVRERDRRAEINTFVKDNLKERKQRDKQLFMELDDVLELLTVKAMLVEDDYRQPVTQTAWEAAWDRIETEMDAHSEQIKRDLVQLIIDARPTITSPAVHASSTPLGSPPAEAEIDAALLLSPSTFFDCTRCTIHLSYPALLEHRHGYLLKKWTLEDLVFNAKATATADALLVSLHGNTGDGHEDVAEKRLLCLRCDENITMPMDWVELVQHFDTEQEWYDKALLSQQAASSSSIVTLYNDHALDTESPMAVILDATAVAKQKDKVLNWRVGPRRATCGLCKWQRWRTRKEVEVHIKSKHLKDPPGKDDVVEPHWSDPFMF